MSKVISFRLDDSKPREAQALEVLKAWVKEGYTLRFVLTKALFELGHPDTDIKPKHDGCAMQAVLDQIDQVFEIVKSMQPDQPTKQHSGKGSMRLSNSFIASVRKTVKPGFRSHKSHTK